MLVAAHTEIYFMPAGVARLVSTFRQAIERIGWNRTVARTLAIE
jgi:hypothetical protein